jgi:hypothetical protein
VIWMPPKASTVDRGYGGEHRKLRRRWAVKVAAGNVMCARCGGWIAPGSRWCLDHSDNRDGYIGPSHERCNIAAGARKGARISNANRDRRRRWSTASFKVRSADVGRRAWSRQWL